MKKLIFSGLLALFFISTSYAQYDNSYYGRDRTGYEGDYFSLEGALHVFKESRTLKDFERKINSKDNWVNNLDLNYDGRTDYIRVEHRQRGDFHAIILQALVDRREVQDVAVIEIEVIRRGDAILQIVGDEDLYGEEVYVEPIEGYSDNRRGYNSNYGDYVNVYYWRPVQYILDRQYQTYNSPYYWSSYPTWWSPWRQYSWNAYRPRIVVYFNYYRIAPRHRVVRVHNFYRPYRSYCNSVVVRTNKVRVKHGKSPIYRSTPYGGQNNRSQADQRNRTTQNSRRSSGSSIYSEKSNQNSSANRNRSSSREHDNIKTRSPQTNPQSRNYEKNRERSGSSIDWRNAERNSSVSRKRSSSSSSRERDNIKTRSPEIKRNSGNSSSRSRTYEPSRNDRSRVSTPSRSKTTTRSTAPTRRSTVKSSSRTPTPKSKASSSSSSKKSSSNTVSRSRKKSGN